MIQSWNVWYAYAYFEIVLLLQNREIKPTYRDAISERKNLIFEIKKIIIQHPLLGGKLKLPDTEIHRLRYLLSQRFHSTILVWSWYMHSYFPSLHIFLVVLPHCACPILLLLLISRCAFLPHMKFIYCSIFVSLKWQKHQKPDQDPDLLRDHDSNSIPSASALMNSGIYAFIVLSGN